MLKKKSLKKTKISNFQNLKKLNCERDVLGFAEKVKIPRARRADNTKKRKKTTLWGSPL